MPVAVTVAVALLAIGVRTAGSEPLKCNTGVLLFDADVELAGTKSHYHQLALTLVVTYQELVLMLAVTQEYFSLRRTENWSILKRHHQKLALMLAGTPLLLGKSHLILTYAHYLLIAAAD